MESQTGKSPNNGNVDVPPPSSQRRWFVPLLIVIVVVLGYGIAPTRLPLWGEEHCRALHGIEMAWTGDWVIARNQGVAILDRPPLQYWVLGVIHKWIHPLDFLTIRLSMVVVTLCTSLLIWWYASRFLPEGGAFAAAVAYPTMGHVFDLGRRIETDGLFTMMLAGSLLVWHLGYLQRWKPGWTWIAGMTVAALATLTKGTQGPIAFFGTVYLFLLIRRDWKYLFHWSHPVGILVFLGIIAIWQVPFYLLTGWEGTALTWLAPYTGRLDTDFFELLKHLVVFPFEIFGGLLPWSVLLLGLTNRQFWPLEEKARSAFLFLLLGIATIFIPVWFSEGGKGRYLMPMYPLVAIVCGMVAHKCMSADMTSSIRKFWRGYLRVMGIMIAVVTGFFFIITLAASFIDVPWVQMLGQPWSWMIFLIIAALLGVGLIWRQTSKGHREHGLLMTFTLASLIAICYNGPVLNAQAHHASRIGPTIVEFRDSLPAGTRLVSFELLDDRFLYWYGEPIPILDRPERMDDVSGDVDYFALLIHKGKFTELPFEWEKVADFIMDRQRVVQNPNNVVVIGRRITSR